MPTGTGPILPLSRCQDRRVDVPLLPAHRPLACQSRAVQTFIVLSRLPEAIRWPSGEKATDQTLRVCPLSVITSRPLDASQTFIVLSPLPEARDCLKRQVIYNQVICNHCAGNRPYGIDSDPASQRGGRRQDRTYTRRPPADGNGKPYRGSGIRLIRDCRPIAAGLWPQRHPPGGRLRYRSRYRHSTTGRDYNHGDCGRCPT